MHPRNPYCPDNCPIVDGNNRVHIINELLLDPLIPEDTKKKLEYIECVVLHPLTPEDILEEIAARRLTISCYMLLSVRDKQKQSVPFSEVDMFYRLLKEKKKLAAKSANSGANPAEVGLTDGEVGVFVNRYLSKDLAPISAAPYGRMIRSPHAELFYNLLVKYSRTVLPFPTTVLWRGKGICTCCPCILT